MEVVIFSTKCWGGDYQKFLAGAYQRKLDAINPYEPLQKWLIFNNVSDSVTAETFVGCGADLSLNAETFWGETLSYFDLKEEDFGSGVPYSISELVELAICKQANFDYLIHYSSDSLSNNGDWITPAIEILKKEKDVIVVSPKSEVNTWHDKNGYDHFFSDQCFLLDVKKVPKDFSKYGEPLKEYPKHGGMSFEHMLGKFMHAKGLKRKILEDFWYDHPAY